MLRHFTISNYRSIRDKKTLSLVSADSANNVRPEKVIALYGANSSGKSNVLRAMSVMKAMVCGSVKLNDGDALMYDPFLLNDTNKYIPTFMEVIYSEGEETIRYGFEYSKYAIEREWLCISRNEDEEKPYFLRQDQQIMVYPEFHEGQDKEENTNDNRLFLSLVAQLGGTKSKQIVRWFNSVFNSISGLKSNGYEGFTLRMLDQHTDCYEPAINFLKQSELGIEDVIIKEQKFEESMLPKDLPESQRKKIFETMRDETVVEVHTKHNVYSESGAIIGFLSPELDEFESEGTKKLINISGPLFDTLHNGSILIVDELDAKMHPLMSQRLISLFQNESTNPNGAQLIFNTHDTHLLSSRLLREQQVWFTEKDATDGTDVYAFTDLVMPDGSKPDYNENTAIRYIQGRYGAIPYFNN